MHGIDSDVSDILPVSCLLEGTLWKGRRSRTLATKRALYRRERENRKGLPQVIDDAEMIHHEMWELLTTVNWKVI
jgi:hypothetical protein